MKITHLFGKALIAASVISLFATAAHAQFIPFPLGGDNTQQYSASVPLQWDETPSAQSPGTIRLRADTVFNGKTIVNYAHAIPKGIPGVQVQFVAMLGTSADKDKNGNAKVSEISFRNNAIVGNKPLTLFVGKGKGKQYASGNGVSVSWDENFPERVVVTMLPDQLGPDGVELGYVFESGKTRSSARVLFLKADFGGVGIKSRPSSGYTIPVVTCTLQNPTEMDLVKWDQYMAAAFNGSWYEKDVMYEGYTKLDPIQPNVVIAAPSISLPQPVITQSWDKMVSISVKDGKVCITALVENVALAYRIDSEYYARYKAQYTSRVPATAEKGVIILKANRPYYHNILGDGKKVFFANITKVRTNALGEFVVDPTYQGVDISTVIDAKGGR